uniref:Uncharacterized protein n=1 Tax=Chromera velia CCMP2878 TaxID=1169474 RepID=A0A0G4I9H3_9ALVE|eukprot:Cvel_12271.t1-p1 / transcript=Cvel_12271.t1 / gene=Cvel_12271 / organism=Chromera_velia_CCMP2878 / gene_product=hypothetical protein / transcript_product=hypothetical protein / location=Cvel_scaffold795:44851-45514(+) / protein_length=109 / sequence_SO=supercontig / SO=protein_coding / is_pseudo=false
MLTAATEQGDFKLDLSGGDLFMRGQEEGHGELHDNVVTAAPTMKDTKEKDTETCILASEQPPEEVAGLGGAIRARLSQTKPFSEDRLSVLGFREEALQLVISGDLKLWE